MESILCITKRILCMSNNELTSVDSRPCHVFILISVYYYTVPRKNENVMSYVIVTVPPMIVYQPCVKFPTCHIHFYPIMHD